jgi:hypothetical protein
LFFFEAVRGLYCCFSLAIDYASINVLRKFIHFDFFPFLSGRFISSEMVFALIFCFGDYGFFVVELIILAVVATLGLP